MRVPAVFPLVLLSACYAGCSSDDASPAYGFGGSPSGGGQATLPDEPTTLKFESVENLPARTPVLLKVQALPARVYDVSFALPATEGDPLDAVLDSGRVSTDASGIAQVQLTTPSSPTQFNVRATVGRKVADLSVTIADTGVASLQVQPLYAGFRAITTWVASAHPDKTCAKLPGIPPADGPLQTLPSAANAAPQLSEVPAGMRLAITLRSGHFVGGCASVEKVAPGPLDKPQIVQVTVLDRPIDLSASPLTVSLGLATPDTTWAPLLEATQAEVLQALLGTSTDDVDALLDAMREASGVRQPFENARQAEAWDDLLRSYWGASAASKLRDICTGWLVAGRQSFATDGHLLSGTLTPINQPNSPLDQRNADFTLTSFAGIEGSLSGFVDRAQVAWSASSDDTLLLGTDLYFVRSKLLQALAQKSALASEIDAGTAAQRLAEKLDCAGVGAALTSAGSDEQLAYAACDATCLTEVCNSAVAAIWQRGGDASGLSPAHLQLTATGAARVGDAAEVVGVSGNWIGALTATNADEPTSGVLTAVAPAL